jgi:protein O-mannosyl-transferase
MQKKWITIPWVQLLLFCVLSFVIFFPNLSRSFASDDFLVLKRVGIDKVIWIKGFFRPVTDMIHYLNYCIGGFNPVGYYALHILMHGINSWLLLQFCRNWKWVDDERVQRQFAMSASLLFLAYPFHSEGVSWILGISALSAGLFGMAALLAVVSGISRGSRIFWCCLFYFIALACYESVMLLPLMVLVIVYGEKRSLRAMGGWIAALGGTLGVHLVVRVLVSGVFAGEYGGKFFGGRLFYYAKNFIALLDRLFLPPIQDLRVQLACGALLAAGLVVLAFSFWRAVKKEGGWRRVAWRLYFIQLMLLLGISCLVPVLSGVSTHTCESDRFLYFPSYFFCAGVAFVMGQLIRDRRWLYGLVGVVMLYEIFFVEVNNRNWQDASDITQRVLAGVRAQLAGGKRVFVVNLPDEQDGAYIFRLGLPEALLMEGVDTSKLVIVNHLVRDEELTLPDSLSIGGGGGVGGSGGAGGGGSEPGVDLAPDVNIKRTGVDSFQIVARSGGGLTEGRRVWTGRKGDVVLYWNRKRFLNWDLEQ